MFILLPVALLFSAAALAHRKTPSVRILHEDDEPPGR